MREAVCLFCVVASACTSGALIDEETEAETTSSVSGTTAKVIDVPNAQTVGTGISADVSDGVTVTAYYERQMTLGQSVLAADPGADFLADLDAHGRTTFARNLYAGDIAAFNHLVRDASGNLYTTGIFRTSLDLGCGTLVNPGPDEFTQFIVKLRADGACLFSRAFARTPIMGLAVDAAGDLVIVGQFQGELSVGPIVLTAPSERGFIAKIRSSDGKVLWAHRVGPAEGYTSESPQMSLEFVGCDGFGNIIVGGYTDSVPFDFGNGPITNSVFVAILDSSGQGRLTRVIAPSTNASIGAMAVNDAGQIALSGGLYRTTNFGRHTLEPVPFSSNSYTVMLNPDGRDRWATQIWGVSGPSVTSIAIKPNGNVYVTGWTSTGGGLHIGDVRFEIPADTIVGFAAKLSSTDGVPGWRRVFGAADATVMPMGITTTTNGTVAVAGSYRGTVDFGTGPVTAHPTVGSVDGFILRLYP